MNERDKVHLPCFDFSDFWRIWLSAQVMRFEGYQDRHRLRISQAKHGDKCCLPFRLSEGEFINELPICGIDSLQGIMSQEIVWLLKPTGWSKHPGSANFIMIFASLT